MSSQFSQSSDLALKAIKNLSSASSVCWHYKQFKISLQTDTGLMVNLWQVSLRSPALWHSKQSKPSLQNHQHAEPSFLALKAIHNLGPVSMQTPALWHSKQSNLYLLTDTGLIIELCLINFQSPAIWHSKQTTGLINEMYPVNLLNHRIDD